MSLKQRTALKDAVTQILSCALQPDNEIQRLAEERKKALEMIDDYPFILIEIMQSSEEALAEKEMASVFLKNYLEDFFLDKIEIAKSSHLLSKLSVNLVSLLTHDCLIIKTKICQSLISLVYKGFWPYFGNKIMEMLQNDNNEQSYAALLFFNHFFHSEIYYIPIAKDYLEIVLNLYQKDFPPETRLELIRSIYFLIKYSIKHKERLNRELISHLSQLFERTLQEPYSPINNFQIQSEIIKALTSSLLLESDHCSLIISPNLPAVGQLMTNCCHEYKRVIMNQCPIPRDPQEDENDSENTNFHCLIVDVLKLVNELIFKPEYAEILTSGLDNLLYCLFVFMSCTDGDMETFILLDEEDEVPVPTRRVAIDTLTNILESLQPTKSKIFYSCLHNVYQRHINECNNEKTNNEVYYARITESLMYGLGILRNFSPKNTNFKNHTFPFIHYLDYWSDLIRNEMNFLILGRLYWMASKYSSILSANTLTVHLKSTMMVFQTQYRILFIPCAKAIRNHLEAFEYMNLDNRMIITNYSHDLVASLFRISQKLPNKPEMCLNAMANLFKYNKDISRIYSQNIQNYIIESITTHYSDNNVLRQIKFLLSSLATHDNCMESLQELVIPFIMKLISNNPVEKLRGYKDAPEKGLEFLNTLITYSPVPISDYLLTESFLAACKFILENDDKEANLNDTVINFLETVIVKLSPQLKTLHNDKGINLASYIPKILFELLDPSNTVWSNNVGRFCVISIMSINGDLETDVELLLKSVLSSFQVSSSNFIRRRALMLIFAYIFMCHPDSTTNFLSSVPGPNGGSALSYLFNKWNANFVTICGKFEKTILTMALIEIIRYAIDGGNSDKINSIMVNFSKYNKLSGIEFLFYLLLRILLSETEDYYDDYTEAVDMQRQQEEEYLFKFHPISNFHITPQITNFLKNYSIYYLNVVRNSFNYHDLERLQSFQLIPDLSMESL